MSKLYTTRRSAKPTARAQAPTGTDGNALSQTYRVAALKWDETAGATSLRVRRLGSEYLLECPDDDTYGTGN